MGKKEYERPRVIHLNDKTVYGQLSSPLGQCNGGSSPEGATYGCEQGNDVTMGNCAFGQYPKSSSCGGGSKVGYANQCATGTTLGS